MAFGLSDAGARGVTHDGVVTTFPAGSLLDLYSGSRPADANTAPAGTKLATIVLPATPWGAAAVRGTPKQGTWATTGLAGAGTGTLATWARLKLAADNGTTDATQVRMDMNVVQAPTAGDLQLDNATIAQNQNVSVTSGSVNL